MFEDETEHALEIKINSKKYRLIADDDLGAAAQFALLEAREWDDAVKALQQFKKRFECQICVMALFSTELYFKAILMAKSINVTSERGFRHDIESMFDRLTDVEKMELREGVVPSGKQTYDIDGSYIDLSSFDTELKYISNDFIELRYHYEKFMHGEPIITCPDFIIPFHDNVKKLARRIVYPQSDT